MQTFFKNWSWKGFLVRYIILLVVLTVAHQLMTSDDPSSTSTDIQMKVTHKVVGKDLHLSFELKNFELSFENVNKEKVNGQGHIHLYIDGDKVMKIYQQEYVWQQLEPGTHEVRIELAHNDHEPVGVEKSFTIEVAE